jgi:hypothetical protein
MAGVASAVALTTTATPINAIFIGISRRVVAMIG